MKTILILSFLVCYYSSNAQVIKHDSIVAAKLDSLSTAIHNLITTANRVKKNDDTTILKIAKLEDVFKRSESSWWEKWMPSIVALITVIISSTAAYRIGLRNVEMQSANAERQVNAQAAVAADQIEISRQQIEQTARNTIEQVRSNNLTQARLDWIKNLRPLLSELLPTVFQTRVLLEEYLEEKIELEKLEAKFELGYPYNTKALANQINELEIASDAMEKSIISLQVKIDEKKNQIFLFLNPEFLTHKQLEHSLNHFVTYISDFESMNLNSIETESNKVINEARLVLNEAWNLADKEAKITFKPQN